ncbi:transcriptional regulator, MarR family [Arboricoccus pini]|uniref:Transcriptional regulator, MarR family n=1 Tax=Arboricoccus pini TaxID=1963835 RepID=A0A212R4C4_9PROT|nr:MarR family transcriptional regulator [Arboricoccus pini]SNB66876.1 transcriptional regulator, MarR family [Arboricoccus pini]
MKSSADAPVDDNLAFLLVTAARLLRGRLESALQGAELDISTSESRTLAMAQRLGAVRQAELAASLGIEPMSLVSHLDRLEKAGLIRRTADPNDRRSKLVLLTPAAQPQLKQIRKVLDDARRAAMHAFSTTELATFQVYLQRLCRDLMNDV